MKLFGRLTSGYLWAALLLSVPIQAQEYFGDTESIQLAALIEDERRPRPSYTQPYREPVRSSWALAVDNDIFAPPQRDQDYTYGFNFTYTGSGARDLPVSLDGPLGALDRFLGTDKLTPKGVHNHSFEVGLFGFTPEDIEV